MTQLELPAIAVHFPPDRPLTRRQRTPSPPGHPDPVILSNALTAENIGFFTFALILALHRHQGAMTLASLSRTVGHSYYAVRSQVVNTHYFAFAGKNPLVTVALTDDAGRILGRIEKRLAAAAP